MVCFVWRVPSVNPQGGGRGYGTTGVRVPKPDSTVRDLRKLPVDPTPTPQVRRPLGSES